MTGPALHFIPAAKADLQEIWHYTVSNWGETQAEHYVEALKHACHLLAESPSLGTAVPDVGKDVRGYRCQHHYIFYLEEETRIIFLAFMHEKREILRHLLVRLS